MRIAIIGLALFLIGCTPSFTELRAERDTIDEELPRLTVAVALTKDGDSLYFVKELGFENHEEAKARLEKLKSRRAEIESLLRR